MRMARVALMIVLMIGFSGCKSATREKAAAAKQEEVAAKIREGNEVLAQITKATDQWIAEYMKAFNPKSRAQFPANRASLQTSADKIMKTLDEQRRLSNQAIQHFEQVQEMMPDEQKRKGMGLIISSMKKSQHTDDLFRSQMQLVSDESIVDEKTFNERFMRLVTEIGQVRGETQGQLEEGRRLLGW